MSTVTRRWTIVAVLSCALPLGAVAQTLDTPQAFLQAIYFPYKEKNFKGQPYWESSRFFVPQLAAAIDRDFKDSKKRGEPPTLDGDPFVDAQDWQITSVSLATSVSGNKAAGAVAFVDSGKPRGVVVDLVKTEAGWRIADILAPSGSLRALYKLR